MKEAKENISIEEKCSVREFRQVQDFCRFMGLRHPLHFNFEKEYWTEVFEPMLMSYERGETPNPDVDCNRWVKFGCLLRKLEEMESGSSSSSKWWLATGHYAHIGYPESSCPDGIPHLLRSRDPKKDQTYFLSTIEPKYLDRLIFPLSVYNLTKPDVYKLARDYQFPGWIPGIPERKESMGLCFVEPAKSLQGIHRFRAFLSEFLEPNPGVIVAGEDLPPPDGPLPENVEPIGRLLAASKVRLQFIGMSLEPGTVLGQHQGLWTATVGERINISLPQGDYRYHGRWYVAAKDVKKNQIEVVRGLGNRKLWSSGIITMNWFWLGKDCQDTALTALSSTPPPLPMPPQTEGDGGEKKPVWEERLVMQFRHTQQPVRVSCVELLPTEEQRGKDDVQLATVAKLKFETPQRSVAVGQSVAIWWGERCLGGAVIASIIR